MEAVDRVDVGLAVGCGQARSGVSFDPAKVPSWHVGDLRRAARAAREVGGQRLLDLGRELEAEQLRRRAAWLRAPHSASTTILRTQVKKWIPGASSGEVFLRYAIRFNISRRCPFSASAKPAE